MKNRYSRWGHSLNPSYDFSHGKRGDEHVNGTERKRKRHVRRRDVCY